MRKGFREIGWCVAGLALAGAAGGATITWDGNGNSNAGGNWSVGVNWDSDSVPATADTAILPDVTVGTRNVTVDVNTVVANLTIQQSNNSYGNNLVLAANLSATNWSGAGWWCGNSRIYMNGYTLVLGVQPVFGNFMTMVGGGTIIKKTTGFFSLANDGAAGFTGQWIVEEGEVGVYYSSAMTTPSGVIVSNGATLKGHSFTLGYIPLTLNGLGYGGQGALSYENGGVDMTWTPTVTLASTSGISVAGTQTLTMGMPIGGSGGLVKMGTGKLKLTATATYTGETIVSNGSMEVGGAVGIVIANSHITVRSGAVLRGPAWRYPQGVTVDPGGTWDASLPDGWWGNGDPNNSSNWWSAANWGEGVVPNGAVTAKLVSVIGVGNSGTAYRTITVDSNTSVDTLQVIQDNDTYGNCLSLAADLSVTNWSGAGWWCYKSRVYMNGHTLRIGSQPVFGNFMPFSGGGLIIKTTAGTVSLGNGATDGFSGKWQIDQGIVDFVWGSPTAATNITVNSGGKARIASGTVNMPSGEMVLNGNGGDGNGALEVTGASLLSLPANPVTIQSDAVIKVAGSQTTLGGTLRGPGRLTQTGAGTLALSGWIFAPLTGNRITAIGGVLAIGSCSLTVTNADVTPPGEYVMVDYSAGGSVSGAFAATNGLPPRWWSINYAGTAKNPACVVLKCALGGTVIVIR